MKKSQTCAPLDLFGPCYQQNPFLNCWNYCIFLFTVHFILNILARGDILFSLSGPRAGFSSKCSVHILVFMCVCVWQRPLGNRDILSSSITLSHLLSHGRVRLLLKSSEIGLDVVNKSEDPGVRAMHNWWNYIIYIVD